MSNRLRGAKLKEIINKVLEKDRDLRYQHASDMRAELQCLKRDTESGRVGAGLVISGSDFGVPYYGMFYFPPAVRLAGRILQGCVTVLAALPGVPFWLFSIMLMSALGRDLIWSMPWLDVSAETTPPEDWSVCLLTASGAPTGLRHSIYDDSTTTIMGGQDDPAVRVHDREVAGLAGGVKKVFGFCLLTAYNTVRGEFHVPLFSIGSLADQA
jgi:hypothetical protein